VPVSSTGRPQSAASRGQGGPAAVPEVPWRDRQTAVRHSTAISESLTSHITMVIVIAVFLQLASLFIIVHTRNCFSKTNMASVYVFVPPAFSEDDIQLVHTREDVQRSDSEDHRSKGEGNSSTETEGCTTDNTVRVLVISLQK